jgi:hypothetical protein
MFGPHDVPAAANPLASQPPWALHVPGVQVLPSTLHAAPTAGIAMHLAAPSHFPLVLSQDFGDATVQVDASGRFCAAQFPLGSQSATSHGPTLAAHAWPTTAELHLPWALQMPLPHGPPFS